MIITFRALHLLICMLYAIHSWAGKSTSPRYNNLINWASYKTFLLLSLPFYLVRNFSEIVITCVIALSSRNLIVCLDFSGGSRSILIFCEWCRDYRGSPENTRWRGSWSGIWEDARHNIPATGGIPCQSGDKMHQQYTGPRWSRHLCSVQS